MGSRKPTAGRSRGSAAKSKAGRSAPSKPIRPRGPYNRHGERWEARWTKGRFSRGWEWVRFRLRVGLGDTAAVARLLDVSVKSIRRYEYDRAPRWYQAALVGLAGIHGAPPDRMPEDPLR